MMIADPVEQRGLAEEDQEGEDGITDIGMVKNGVQAMQDQPVQVIVLRMQLGPGFFCLKIPITWIQF